MMTRHVLARVLILSGLTALIGIAAVVHFARPLGQSVSTETEAKAPSLVQSVWTEVEANAPPLVQNVWTVAEANAPSSVQVLPSGPDGHSPSNSVQDTPSPTQSPATIVATSPQETAPVTRPAITERTMATGSLAAQAPTAGVLAPAPASFARPIRATRVEAPAPSTSPDPTRVNINRASVEELNRHSGQLGKAIVQDRPYRSVDDLIPQRIVKRTVFSRIKGRIAAR